MGVEGKKKKERKKRETTEEEKFEKVRKRGNKLKCFISGGWKQTKTHRYAT